MTWYEMRRRYMQVKWRSIPCFSQTARTWHSHVIFLQTLTIPSHLTRQFKDDKLVTELCCFSYWSDLNHNTLIKTALQLHAVIGKCRRYFPILLKHGSATFKKNCYFWKVVICIIFESQLVIRKMSGQQFLALINGIMKSVITCVLLLAEDFDNLKISEVFLMDVVHTDLPLGGPVLYYKDFWFHSSIILWRFTSKLFACACAYSRTSCGNHDKVFFEIFSYKTTQSILKV